MYHVEEIVSSPERLERFARSLEGLEPPELRCAKIKLTSRCNLRCRMCRYGSTRGEDSLDTASWRRVLEELRALGCRKVHFSGGEVFLRPDFLDLVEHAAGLGFKVNMTTNGTLLTPERIRRLIRARPNSLSVSLDGPRARIHDAVRGVPGSFQRTSRALRRLGEAGRRFGRSPRLRVNFVLMESNWRYLPDMVDLAAALGAVELHPMPVDEKGERRLRLSKGKIRRFNEEVAPRALERRRLHGFSTHPDLVWPFGTTEEDLRLSARGLYARGAERRQSCLAPWLHLFLAWDGECYLCCMTNGRMESLGKAGRVPLAEIFRGEAMARVRASFLAGRPHPACARCDMFGAENRTLHRALESQEPGDLPRGP